MRNNYRSFCETEKSIPIFSKPWWLDAVAGKEGWDVIVLSDKNSKVIATMPYVIQKKMFLTLSVMPKLTQTLGPWMSEYNGKYSKKLAYEKDAMNALIREMPKFSYFDQSWHYSLTNWLPFYWNGFRQTTRYTYVIEELSDLNAVYSRFESKIKGDIKKAQNRFSLTVRDDLPIEAFLTLNHKVFERQGLKTPYSDDFIMGLDKACIHHGCRKLLVAVDENGNAHAGVYIVWDDYSAYYLLGGADPDLRNSGATSLCLWEAIQFAATVTSSFDFEGSMLEPVERFVRGFGAIQKPYFSVSKASSPLMNFTAYCYKKYRKK